MSKPARFLVLLGLPLYALSLVAAEDLTKQLALQSPYGQLLVTVLI